MTIRGVPMSKYDKPGKAHTVGPSKQQPRQALASSASAARTLHAPLEQTPLAPAGGASILERGRALEARLAACHTAYTCKLTLKLAFFFDGTGNNFDADKGTLEHSNVARLFNDHPDGLEHQGIYRFYIPGLGTYFRQIGDIGDDDGMAFGKYGEERLDKAMQWLSEAIAKHGDKIVE